MGLAFRKELDLGGNVLSVPCFAMSFGKFFTDRGDKLGELKRAEEMREKKVNEVQVRIKE